MAAAEDEGSILGCGCRLVNTAWVIPAQGAQARAIAHPPAQGSRYSQPSLSSFPISSCAVVPVPFLCLGPVANENPPVWRQDEVSRGNLKYREPSRRVSPSRSTLSLFCCDLHAFSSLRGRHPITLDSHLYFPHFIIAPREPWSKSLLFSPPNTRPYISPNSTAYATITHRPIAPVHHRPITPGRHRNNLHP